MFTIDEILQATRGKLISNSSPAMLSVQGASTDSRTIKPGDLFLAIQGDRFDGHRFIEQAIQQKAGAVVVSQRDKKFFQSYSSDVPIIWVPNTTKALGQIARFHRCRFSIPIIAITGSTGKTTTKELIARLLGCRYRVLKNVATENNHIGVPQTLLRLTPEHQIAVIEFGTNQFGDIRWLSEITAPTAGVFTNIGESHLEFLKTPEGVLKEKSEMLQFLKPPGNLFLNNDDPYLEKLKEFTPENRLITYGIKNPADFQASELELNKDLQISFSLKKRYSFQLNTPAEHNIYNVLAAIACGRFFKISFQDIKRSLASFEFPKGRQAIKQNKGMTVIDDTYNANPVSVKSALNTLANIKSHGRKIFICADMLELGKKARALHSQIGTIVGGIPVDAVFTLGGLSQWISKAAKKKNKNLVSDHFDSLEGIHNRLREYCQPGDVILVKGSRGMKMERTVEFLSKVMQEG